MTDVDRPGGGVLMMPRSRGGLTGFVVLLLGAWGAVIPFVGPYFNYAYTPNASWTWTSGRFFLQVLPGAVAFFAGAILLVSRHRVIASAAAWLAVAAGAWFVVGPLLAPLWRTNYLGTPVGDTSSVSVEQIGMFYGLGAAIVLFAAVAIGRFSVIGVRDVAYADRVAAQRPAPVVPARIDPGEQPAGAYPAAPMPAEQTGSPSSGGATAPGAAAAADASGATGHGRHWIPRRHRYSLR
jgi:hypothetical protein